MTPYQQIDASCAKQRRGSPLIINYRASKSVDEVNISPGLGRTVCGISPVSSVGRAWDF